jgi:8-oxo-dGTP pyrophosphatase MutT (NUDIX family)
LHRVHTSSSFASAHVFPGGNVSPFHDGSLPAADTPELHEDGSAYRLAAIRETFEESGILLAKRIDQTRDQGLLHVPDDVREAGRKQIHGNAVKFTEWLKNVGGEPDVGMSDVNFQTPDSENTH